jgi:hypothetical protein
MKFKRWEGGGQAGYSFFCPGCKERHQVRTEGGASRWSFNGDVEKPVLSPSVLVTSGHYAAGRNADGSCWCTYNAEQLAKGEPPAPHSCQRCHSFVGCNGAQPGQIIFLGDSTHELVGQTVELPDLPVHRDGGGS